MEQMWNAYRIFVRKPRGESQVGRRRRRGEDNIELDFRETGYKDGR
jgi:hypothetical protein